MHVSRALGLFMDALCVKDTDTGICRVNTGLCRINTGEQWCMQGEHRVNGTHG